MKTPALLITSLAALSCFASAQQLVLPDNMNLGYQTATAGLTTVFRTTAGRFQVIYDTSHFINAGVTGPVLIGRLRFRAEDSESNLGGNVYTGIIVQVGTAAVDHAAMSTTFAANVGVLGPVGLATVTIAPASGTVPNDYVIDIDLVSIGAAVLYDPTTGSDLLIDMTMPLAPLPATGLVPFTAGSAVVATARGRMMTAATAVALTGVSSAPPVVQVTFAGPGGTGAIIPATTEAYGASCGGAASTFYQFLPMGQPFDLAGSGLTLTPDNVAAPNFYIVTGGAPAPDVTQVNAVPNSVADDAVVTHPLGFTFNYPGGSTITAKPCTNGFVWIDAAMTATDYSPTLLEYLGNTAALPQRARFALCWHDLHAGRNTTTHPNSGLHVKTDVSGGAGNAVCYATWFNIGDFNTVALGGHSVNTFQCVLHEATGVVEYRYGAMSALTGGGLSVTVNAIVGFTRGQIGAVNSVDPGTRDLSFETPFITSIEGAVSGVGHTVSGRMVQGTAVTFSATNNPAGTPFGGMLIAVGGLRPGISFPPLGAGCMASLNLAVTSTYQLFFAPPSTVTSVPFAVPASGFLGTQLFTQYALLTAGGTALTSNAIAHRIGLN